MPEIRQTRIPLGCVAKEKYTGFIGLVVATHDHVTGCDQRVLESLEMVDGELVAPQVFDVDLLEELPNHERAVTGVVPIEPKIPLDTVVVDRVTGVKGAVIVSLTLLFGSPELLVQPMGLTANGVPMKCMLLAETRVVREGALEPEPKPETPRKGGRSNIEQYRR